MMLHDKMIAGQFLLDMHKEGSFSLQSSPNKLDLYSAAYQYRSMQFQPEEPEVLDLSRRWDSAETRTTPSPYNSTSSYGTRSPSTYSGSPSSQPGQAGQIIPSNLIYSSNNNLLPPALASMYPFYPKIKREKLSPPPPQYTLPYPQNPAALIESLSRMQSQVKPHEAEDRLSDNSGSISPTSSTVSKMTTANDSKPTRPFKVYPRDPVVIAANFAASDILLDNPQVERYTEYRKRVLDQIRSSNGGHRTVTNPKMRRTNNRQSSVNEGSNSDNQNNNNSDSEERAIESSDNDSSGMNVSMTENSSSADNKNGSKDPVYLERRRKNNAAAKKSRDRRRIKEDEIAIRAGYLERHTIELRCENDALKAQLERQNIEFRCQIDALKTQLATLTKC